MLCEMYFKITESISILPLLRVLSNHYLVKITLFQRCAFQKDKTLTAVLTHVNTVWKHEKIVLKLWGSFAEFTGHKCENISCSL